jgi:hypothetical protein
MGDDIEKEALSNPSRRRIIEVIGSAGKMSFSQIKKETNISTGAIYYHLTRLRDFVEVDEKRRYYLNKNGEKLCQQITSGYSIQKKEGETTSFPRFMLTPLVRNMTKSKTTAIAAIILIPAIEIIISYFAQKSLIFFAPMEQHLMDAVYTPILLSIVPLWLTTKIFTLVFVKENFGEIELLAGVGVSTLPPSLILPLALYNPTIYQIGAVISIIISTILLASTINLVKGVSLQTSIIYSMIIGYISFMIEVIVI